MTRSVIYFPYIRVPQTQWFTQVLLYWEQVISIVPEELQEDSALGSNMERLIELNLVEPLHPEKYIRRIPNFDETFINYINSPYYPIDEIKTLKPHFVDVNRKKLDLNCGFSQEKVHSDKISPNILDSLRQRGLVKRERDPWIEIEAYTANQYMAYLASCLGMLPEINCSPITDNQFNFISINPRYFRAIGPENPHFQQDIIALRGLVLSQIFPIPERVISPEDILDFKRDHRNELNRFRNRIEAFLIGAAAIRDETIRSSMVDQFNTENQDEIRALKEDMEERNWGYITWGRILAYAPSLLALMAPDPLANLGGILVLANAVYRDYMHIRGVDRGNPMAYAMLAEGIGERQ